jgi:hypothetical protein
MSDKYHFTNSQKIEKNNKDEDINKIDSINFPELTTSKEIIVDNKNDTKINIWQNQDKLFIIKTNLPEIVKNIKPIIKNNTYIVKKKQLNRILSIQKMMNIMMNITNNNIKKLIFKDLKIIIN